MLLRRIGRFFAGKAFPEFVLDRDAAIPDIASACRRPFLWWKPRQSLQMVSGCADADGGEVMLARTLNLTLHGLGVPGPGTCPSIARYWLSVARFERLLWQMPVVEAAYGISIALTFDDANRSDFEIARPLLQRYRRSAIMFVPTGVIGTDGRLTGAEIRELAAAGFGIGSHGHRHIDMRTAAEPVLGDELAGSRRRLEDLLGCEVRDLSFPFGTFDARVLREARRAGFRRLFTSAGGFASAAQGLVSRVSLKSDFFPESDLAALARPTERIRSTLIDHLRRAKYAALELA